VSLKRLPAAENLLADKPEHLVERDTDRHPFGENQYGFDMAYSRVCL
jgi:hypothetical protein